MTDDPTEEEVKKLLDYLVPIMVASKVNAPEDIHFCWRDKLHATASALDYCNKNVYALSEVADGELRWVKI